MIACVVRQLVVVRMNSISLIGGVLAVDFNFCIVIVPCNCLKVMDPLIPNNLQQK